MSTKSSMLTDSFLVFRKVSKQGVTEPIQKTADQISTDETMLNDLEPKDAHLIGYVAATEQMQKKKENISKL